jgi:hypothetical protein
VAGIGDLNGDGYDDVLIGAPHTGGWPYPIGRASVYFGGDPMDTTADVTFRGDSIEFLSFGRVVASAGDVNGDGVGDIMVAGVTRRVGLYYTVSTDPELQFDTLILVGETLTSSFGLSITTAGDLNQDGFNDVLVGDYQYGEDLKGRVYLFYGGNPMDSLFDLTLVGDDLAGSRFGYRLAFAGDVNGDGHSEILVSSYGDDRTRKGKVFVYTYKPTSVDENQRTLNPWRFSLGQNYPNPFNSSTTIPFAVDSEEKRVQGASQVKLTIYNILGQKVKTLVDENKPPGYYEVTWDGKNDSGKEVASGVYFYHLKIGRSSENRTMLFLK